VIQTALQFGEVAKPSPYASSLNLDRAVLKSTEGTPVKSALFCDAIYRFVNWPAGFKRRTGSSSFVLFPRHAWVPQMDAANDGLAETPD